MLVKDGHVKVCDFGCSSVDKLSSGRAGTPGYMAPEVQSSQPYDLLVDVYSVGAIHHLLLTSMPLQPDLKKANPQWYRASPSMKRYG